VKAVERYFFGPVAAARPWLLMKLFLLLLAFDCWVDLTPHGGRYGVGDFNVAHFTWLDALAPTPTPAIYVGLICFAGLLAFVNAVGGVNRAALGVLAAVYTYAWTMSMLDSYQHHYLLSIVLLVFVFYPAVTARIVAGADDASARALPGGRLSAWAYHATAVSFGIVYCYTALSKSEPQWRDGSALQRIAPEGMAPFYEYFVGSLGWEHDTFWSLAGVSVIGVQIVIAAAYFSAPLLDRGLGWVKWVCLAGYFGATSFHIGAEHLGLEIGWFSYYMIIAAAVFLLPGGIVGAVGRFAAKPLAAAEAMLSEGASQSALVAAVAAAGITGLAGYAVDMPGAAVGSIAAGVVVLTLVVAIHFAKDEHQRPMPFTVGAILAALCMWVAFTGTEARYDYYRFVGGDHRRRGEHQQALDAYIKANDYAPEDNNRHEKEDEMRSILGLPLRWSGR